MNRVRHNLRYCNLDVNLKLFYLFMFFPNFFPLRTSNPCVIFLKWISFEQQRTICVPVTFIFYFEFQPFDLSIKSLRISTPRMKSIPLLETARYT